MSGKVWLVGAGPGDPELLTIKALRVLKNAQAVVYDRLVSDDVMGLVPHGVPRFFAGKSCSQKAMTQDEINGLLVALAKKGNAVVRLKGGDPLLFGRGGEEALALSKEHIEFEIVPGITAAQGCASYAGIPLTHRGMATGVRFVTGHRRADGVEEPLPLDWRGLADPETTLVVYMGLASLPLIASNLMREGVSGSIPAAAIAHGTSKSQKVVLATLETIAEKAREAGLKAPVLTVIGSVASLASELSWFDPQKSEIAPDWEAAFMQLSHKSS